MVTLEQLHGEARLGCGLWGSHSNGYEEFYLLGYNAIHSVESQLMFWRDKSPQSSKNKPSKVWYLFLADFLFSLFFDPDDAGYVFFGNADLLSMNHTALYSRK